MDTGIKGMIYLARSDNGQQYTSLLQDMYELRAKVFNERLGWDVDVVDGMEIDRFDQHDPLYLLSVDGNDRLLGSLRLLPTTGPNMLADVFSSLLPDGEVIKSPLIWESSRFCVSDDTIKEGDPALLNYVTRELLLGLCEVGMLAGLDSIVTVYDARIKRVVRHAGCEGEILGTPKKFGRVTTYAGLFPVNEPVLSQLRSATGIRESVLAAETLPLLSSPELKVAI